MSYRPGMMRNGRLCTLQMRVRPHRRARCYGCSHRRHPITQENLLLQCMPRDYQGAQMLSEHLYRLGLRGRQPPVCSLDYGFSRKSIELYGKSRLKEEVFHAYGTPSSQWVMRYSRNRGINSFIIVENRIHL